MRPKPLVLAILDGWGIAPKSDGNAIRRAETPNIDRFVREYPAMTLYASSNEVGLSFALKTDKEEFTMGCTKVAVREDGT